MRRRYWVPLMFLLCFHPIPVGAAAMFATATFQTQWQHGESIAPNFWGPLSTAKDGQQEPYQESPNGLRLVQYFDKGRMEQAGDNVTNGLLASEIITGRIQIGDATFQQKPPPAIPIAGDPDNPGPTYAELSGKAKALFDAAPQQTGNYAQASVSPTGDISTSTAGPSPATTFTTYDGPTKHNVPRAFADYRMKAGLATIGYALCEPFSAVVKVAGQLKQVLVQVFERRVLTYTDSNPDAFKVEMGNIGQHYYQWRYASPVGPTVAAAPGIALGGVQVRNSTTGQPVYEVHFDSGEQSHTLTLTNTTAGGIAFTAQMAQPFSIVPTNGSIPPGQTVALTINRGTAEPGVVTVLRIESGADRIDIAVYA